jgi:hypothetical protein
MKTLLSILFFPFMIFLGCGSSNQQLNRLDGTWIKVKPNTPLGGYSIKYTFSGDEFRLRKGVYVDYIDPKDTCRKNRGWVDFAAGKFETGKGIITLGGIWTDSSYINRQVYGCSNLGEFYERYYYKLSGDTLRFNRNVPEFDESKDPPHVYDRLIFVRGPG